MSTLDTDAIAARLEAATPGPWHSEQITAWGNAPIGISGLHGPKKKAAHLGGATITEYIDADAEFIAAAPGDIAALLAEVATLRETLTDAARSLDFAETWLRTLRDTDGANAMMRSLARARDVLGVSRLTEEPK